MLDLLLLKKLACSQTTTCRPHGCGSGNKCLVPDVVVVPHATGLRHRKKPIIFVEIHDTPPPDRNRVHPSRIVHNPN